MTRNQIEKYEIHNSYLKQLAEWERELPFLKRYYEMAQMGSRTEQDIERIHIQMFNKVISAMREAENHINSKIQEL